MLWLLMEEKKIQSKLIESVYNRRGKLIFTSEEKKCINCIQVGSEINYELPIIEETHVVNYRKSIIEEISLKILKKK